MSRLLLLLPLALGLGACTRGVAPGGGAEAGGRAPAAEAPGVASLRAAEEAWARALRRRDYPVLERLLAPEFRLVSPDGAVTTRAEWFENLRGFRVDSVALFHIEPRVSGDSGSVTLELYWHAVVEGRPPIDRTGALRDRWRFREGRWVAVERRTLERRPGYAPSPPR